ncbi:hypothetical protein [Hyphomicrobium sp. CS1BSMeth3]|uniref:hypothetical protein n=1 Tax=Hyphomicrobium sp. CS1BSMeth3 TaxID=1892844 RepID=UPI001160BE71|nr:hypothetical protein [Hyphomicrobium sp. CS1BSMeth3]
MKYRTPADQWNERTGRIASTVSDPAQLPPAIAEYQNGVLTLADGNHRHEGARRKGWATLWVLIWFNHEAEWRASEWFGSSNCAS